MLFRSVSKFAARLAVFSAFLLVCASPAFFSVASVAYAQSQSASASVSTSERIKDFNSTIVVNIDNSIDVTERIMYTTGSQPRHGIYRDIYPYSSDGRKVPISVVSVVDGSGKKHQYSELTGDAVSGDGGGYYRIKIGDPDRTFVGTETYVIKYHVARAVAQLESVDEIYWNVTGNGWNMPIEHSEATVILPAGADGMVRASQSACYYGPVGSTASCLPKSGVKILPDGSYHFELLSKLAPDEGLTVAVGFPKGVVTPYTQADLEGTFWEKYGQFIVAVIIPFLVLLLSFRHWYRHGRDPRGTGVLVPQYDVPEGLTPIEVAVILREKFSPQYISAEIIYLATHGYVKIIETTKRFGPFSSSDYELKKLKDSGDLINEHDRLLLDGIFTARRGEAIGSVVMMSDLKNSFYKKIKGVSNSAIDGLVEKGIYRNLGNMKHGGQMTGVIIFVAIWVSFFFGPLIAMFFAVESAPVTVSIFLSFVIYAIVSHFFPAKTEKGVALYEHLLGLREYLQIAEKDRINFHNAPEKKPAVFDKLLPFAMIFGVEKAWAKEFADIYTTPPDWYSSPGGFGHGGVFNALVLSDSLSHFRGAAVSSMTSVPSSGGSGLGGSGGGGFSGGGGGGGGGGSW